MLEEYSLSSVLDQVRHTNLDESISPLALPDKWSFIQESLRGWINGMVIVAGQANHGKSSLVTNLALALLEANPNLMLIDISLDDDKRNRISRYVSAISFARINDVLFEWSIDKTAPVGQRVSDAIDRAFGFLKSLEGRLIILDAGDLIPPHQSNIGVGVPTIESVSSTVLDVMKSLPPDRQVLLMLDSLNEVSTSNKGLDLLEVQRHVIGRLSVLSNQYNLRILATAHVRKDIAWKNPNMDAIYGDSVIKYYAKAITFVYNDSKEKGGPDNSVFSEVIPPDLDLYYDDHLEGPPRIPIIAWIWKKSKVSSFDGRYFMRFVPWSNTVVPVKQTDNDRYNNLLDQELMPSASKGGG